MKKVFKIIGIIFIIISIILAVFTVLLITAINSMINGNKDINTYDKRIYIWNTVAGNSQKSKLDDMNIDYNSDLFLSTLNFTAAIANKDYKDVEQIVDTFTYLYEIKSGYEKETYEDEPYLIPYIVEGSESTVIIIPGGGYGYKSMDGSTSESEDIALALNENGITAFVLHYRSNPYEYPIPQLDVQRAIRYLRYHSEDYGFNPDNIGLIGYSAGGNQVGTFINKIKGQDLFPEGYIKDKIDNVDDSINSAAMIYPVLDFYSNIPMLFCLFDADDVRDEQKREEILKETELKRYITSTDIPQLVAYGTNDAMVGMTGAKSYIKKAKTKNVEIKEICVEGGAHGFAKEYYINEYIEWFKSNLK